MQRGLRLTPNYVMAHNIRGCTLKGLGGFYAGQFRHVEAEASYRGALGAYGEALRFAPDEVTMHENRGNVFQCLGDLYMGQSRHEEAETCYREALMVYKKALSLGLKADQIRSSVKVTEEKLRNINPKKD